MGKYLIIILAVVLLGAGAYFLIFNKGAISNLPTSIQKMTGITPTPTPADVSDQSIDQDMTALEKDLNSLDTDNAGLANDLNNL